MFYRQNGSWGTTTALKRKPNGPTICSLSLIVLVGFALRLWGLNWSLPNSQHPLATYHPDERVNLYATLAIDIPHGRLDPQFYSYGTLYFYLASFAQTFGRGYDLIPSPLPESDNSTLSSTEKMIRTAPEMAGLLLAGRMVTMLLGTATITLMFALGHRLYGRKTGLVAALLYTVAPLAVVHAHFLTVDVPATFFVTLALMCAARLLTSPTRRNYILAGIACGLCAATKYNTVLVLAAPLVASFVKERQKLKEECDERGEEKGAMSDNILAKEGAKKQKTVSNTAKASGVLILMGTTFVAFLIACPGPLLNWNVFWNGASANSGVRYELFEHSRTGHGLLFVNTGPGWWYHLIVSLPQGLGISLFLLSLMGLTYAFRKRNHADLILLTFFILYYVSTGLSAVRFARYMLPIYPVLCLFGARLVSTSFPSMAMRRIMVLIGILVVLMTSGYTFSLVRLMALPDPRDAAKAYLDTHAPNGASVAFGTVPWFYSPPLSPWFGELDVRRRRLAAQENTRFNLRIPYIEWGEDVLNPLPNYVILSDLETMNPRRLHLKQAVRFMDVMFHNHYNQIYFVHSPLLFAPTLPDAIIPEDLLYIMPTIVIYEKR